MMILSIDTSNIFSFLLGILSGIVLITLMFVIFSIRGTKQSKKIYGPTIKDLNEEKIRELILSKQNAFIFEVEENDQDYLKTLLPLTLELVHEISSYYYPNSKYPEYELTINEAADLIKYIVDQILNIFDKPLLRNLKNMRISFIASAIDKTKKIKNSKVVKTVEKSGATEGFSEIKAITNTLNPIYWFRKIFVKGTINYTIKKVCKAGLSIVGNESNKVYSKNLFKNDDVEKQTNKDIEEIYSDEVK